MDPRAELLLLLATAALRWIRSFGSAPAPDASSKMPRAVSVSYSRPPRRERMRARTFPLTREQVKTPRS